MRTVVAVVVKDGQVLAHATNEHTEPCKREGYSTGVDYELCEGCNYPNHAEYKAVNGGKELAGATVYLLGHTYACDPCKQAVEKSGAILKII